MKSLKKKLLIRPRIFIGSSSESLVLARTMAGALKRYFSPVVWDKDVFSPGTFTIEGLLEEVRKCHLALFVFSKDDIVKLRGRSYKAARDNVVFEFGLFMAKLGRETCFFLAPRSKDPFRIPSDLSGLIHIPYDAGASAKSPKKGLQSAAVELKGTIDKLLHGDGHRLSLTGEWDESWKVKSSNFKSMNGGHAYVLQVGEKKLYARTEAGGRVYMIDGEIDHGIVIGRWYDQEGGPTYSGSFQLRVDGKAQTMCGQWVGFSATSGSIKNGKWVWKRRES